MPNFKCENIHPIILPFSKDGFCFDFVAFNDKERLISVNFDKERFFLLVKKDFNNNFIIKADKYSKPTQTSLLQKALIIFKDQFCENILSQSLAFKNLIKTKLIVKDFFELLAKIKDKKNIFIEIGFGSGRHLLYQAQKNPNIFIIGIELYNPSLDQVARLAKNQNINNILLIKSDARLLLENLESNIIDQIFLHFPVPWDKKPHRRVISKYFIQESKRVLKQGGKFELRTDSKMYFDFALELFYELNNFKIQISKNKTLEIISKYENRWINQKKDIFDLIFINEEKNTNKNNNYEILFNDLSFDKNDLKKIKDNFNNFTFKNDFSFLHFKNLYDMNDGLLLKLSFGSFDKSEHNFLFLGKEVKFVLAKPFINRANFEALKKLKDLLTKLKVLQ